jgi:hypothetical protein
MSDKPVAEAANYTTKNKWINNRTEYNNLNYTVMDYNADRHNF